jgi:large subunit ribosomal protein L15
LPKVGFRSRKAATTTELRLDVLNNLALEMVDILALKTAGVISDNIQRVKVIASGEITNSVTVKGLAVTAGAQKAIEAVGGKVEE